SPEAASGTQAISSSSGHRNIVALTLQLPPDLAHAMDAEVLLELSLNFWLQGVIPSRSPRQPGWIGAPGGVRMVGGWGDRQLQIGSTPSPMHDPHANDECGLVRSGS